MYAARLRMPLLWGALVLLVAGLALYFRVGTVRRPPVEVAAPVAGRWTAINSPADKVPATACTPTARPTHRPGPRARGRVPAGYRLQWVSPSR